MQKLAVILSGIALSVACTAQKPAEPAAAVAPPVPAAKAHSSLLQVMRAIDFPNSNIIFDTQRADPGAPVAKKDDGSATDMFGNMYGGWEKVENASLALAETANLIHVPGRTCSNGKPVPVENADFQKFTQILVDASMASYKAAQAKNLEQMNEATGTVADACAQCHEVFRDRGPEGSPERCVAAPAAPAQ